MRNHGDGCQGKSGYKKRQGMYGKQNAINVEKHKYRETLNRMHNHCCPYAQGRAVKVMHIVHFFGVPLILMLDAMPYIGGKITQKEIEQQILAKLDYCGGVCGNVELYR